MLRPISARSPKVRPVVASAADLREALRTLRLCVSALSFIRSVASGCRTKSTPESFPIRARRNARVPLKQRPKERNVLITHRVADLLHRAMAALQHPLGRRNAQFLQVTQRTVPRSV